jgi:hypothetical protein
MLDKDPAVLRGFLSLESRFVLTPRVGGGRRKQPPYEKRRRTAVFVPQDLVL